MAFQLHHQLLSDTHPIGTFRPNRCGELVSVVHALLHIDASMHWFILVPEVSPEDEYADWLDLPEPDVTILLNMSRQITSFLKTSLHYPRVNFGAIGNIVPQIHLHVIGRRPGDACWPAPVWGHLKSHSTYSSDSIEQIRSHLAEKMSLFDFTSVS